MGTNILDLNEYKKKFFIEREPIFQKLVSEDEIIDVKWIFPKNPTFIGFHNEWEIHFFKRGEGAYFINRKMCEIKRNNVVIIKPKQIHYFIPKKDTEIEKGTLYFTSSLLKQLHLQQLTKKNICHLKLEEEDAIIIEMIFKFLIKEKEEKKKFWKDIILHEMKILILLLERIKSNQKDVSTVNPLVKKILDYIEKNLNLNDDKLNLQKIAQELKFSLSYLSHTFKKFMGISIKQYILQRKIAEAKFIIENNPDIKIYAVAEKLGFSNFALFNRCFKKFVGITPATYRKIALYGIKR